MLEKDILPNKHFTKLHILFLQIIVHFLAICAVFEVYFSSPLNHVLEKIEPIENPPAKRLVIFLAEGLRAESIYDNSSVRAPFLTKIKKSGSWGVAHVKPPAESRTGYGAILAGIPEDPSAIWNGFKYNPVKFDTIFHQSRNVWFWCSPKGKKTINSRILLFPQIYSFYQKTTENYQAYNNHSASIWDSWINTVNAQVATFFEDIKSCDACFQKQNLFMISFPSIGSENCSDIEKYVQTIRKVDETVKNITAFFKGAFLDDHTAFVFTSDCGMPDRCNERSALQTEVPIIAWGAGIQKHRSRHHIQQVDITPLLATLLGISIPKNSLGVIPLQFLDLPQKDKSEIKMFNIEQLIELVKAKQETLEENVIFFKPYKGWTLELLFLLAKKMKAFRKEPNTFFYLSAESNYLVGMLKGAFYYYQNYFQYPLLISVTALLLEYVLIIILAIDENNIQVRNNSKKIEKIAPLILCIIPVLLCFIQNLKLSYYFYFASPFWLLKLLYPYLRYIRFLFKKTLKDNYFAVFLYLFLTEFTLLGLFYRFPAIVLTLFLTLVFTLYSKFDKRVKLLGVILSVFPLFPKTAEVNIFLFLLGIFVWFILLRCHQKYKSKVNRKLVYCQVTSFTLATIQKLFIEFGVISDDSILKYFSWIILLAAFSLIIFSSKSPLNRLMSIFFSFAPFLLLVSYNGSFLFAELYFGYIFIWLLSENPVLLDLKEIYFGNKNVSENKLNLYSLFSLAFLFQYLVALGFLGLNGSDNLTNMNYDIGKAFFINYYTFKTQIIFIISVLIPIFFTCCIFNAFTLVRKCDIFYLLCALQCFSDLILIQLLYLIKNEGSWSEMRSSLATFLVVSFYVPIISILYFLSKILTTVKLKYNKIQF